MKAKILIVEDDIDLSSTVAKFLKQNELSVECIDDGQKAVDIVYEKVFNLILLDVKLPSLSGFDAAKEIREFSSVPILFLTSLDRQKDVEKGLERGGDDYMTKPFSLNELLLRIRAILRRVYGNESKIEIDNSCYFDVEKYCLFKEGEVTHLTEKESKLLSLFLQNKGKIFTKEDIFDILYGYAEESNEASLRVFINHLRKLIGKEKIKTIKNIGYLYVG